MLNNRDNSGDNGTPNFRYYYYEPSMAAAVIFIVLFGISFGVILFRMVRSRTYFMIPFLIATVFETIGYVGRALSASQNPGPYTLGPYIIQSVLILVAPALMAASVYMQLGRIVAMCDADRLLLVRRQWLTKIFVGGDVVSFLLQAGGAGYLSAAKSSSGYDAGNHIIVGGLFIQILFFGVFVATAIVFNVKLRHHPTQRSSSVAWTKQMYCLYAVSILILIRSIVRAVEFIEGFNGYIARQEVFLYIFDALVMFTAVAVQAVIYPATINGKSGGDQEMLSR